MWAVTFCSLYNHSQRGLPIDCTCLCLPRATFENHRWTAGALFGSCQVYAEWNENGRAFFSTMVEFQPPYSMTWFLAKEKGGLSDGHDVVSLFTSATRLQNCHKLFSYFYLFLHARSSTRDINGNLRALDFKRCLPSPDSVGCRTNEIGEMQRLHPIHRFPRSYFLTWCVKTF